MCDKGDSLLSMTKMFLRGTQILLADPARSDKQKQAARLAQLFTPAALSGTPGTKENNPINRAITRYEETEIKALLFYAAQKTGANEAEVALRMMDDLGYVHLDDLNLGDYRLIRAYMWTLLAV